MDLIKNCEEYSVSPDSRQVHPDEPAVDWHEMALSEHFVQFYESDACLADAVSSFLGAGLESGDCCLMIATRTHREAIETIWKARGLDLADARTRGQYIPLDAEDTLAQFMRAGSPDPQRFYEAVGQMVAQAQEGGRRVRAFGEMVALLWAEGNQAGALCLESLWNELAKTHAFSLFCAYPLASMGGDAHTASFHDVCTRHTRVIPAESYTALPGPDERLREIAALQQKAAALEAEIAQRKAAEKELSRRERELTDFLENAIEGIHQVGPDGTILWANRAELDMLGYSPDEYIGHSIAEFHMDGKVIEDMLAHLLRGESLYNFPARLRCKDGSIKQVLVHSNACFEAGKLIHTRCFTHDITALQENATLHQRLAAIVDSSDDAIIGKTLEGIITSWNPGAERIFGYSAGEVIGKPKTILFPPDRLHEETTILARLRRGERIPPFESIRMRKDGTQLHVSLTMSPIKNGTGEIIGASTIARDITDRRRLEAQLLQSQKMEGIGKLAGGIAHEFNNMLTVILGSVELMEDAADTPVLAALDPLKQAAQRSANLTQQLLAFARKQMIQAQVANLNTIIHNLDTLLHTMTGENIVLKLRLAGDPGQVLVDPNQIGQLIINLVVNACDAMPNGGTLTLETENWREPAGREDHFGMAPVSEYVVLRVRDTGSGMTEEVKAHLFEPFFTTKPVGQGTGLGLSVCHGIVEQSKGHITVDSAPGQGTTFTIYLPRVDAATEPAPSPKPSANLLRGTETILLVEDEPTVRQLAGMILRSKGYTVLEAANGLEGLQLLQSHDGSFDLLLTDVVMPQMRGTELAKKLRATYPMLKVILMSGYTEETIALENERNANTTFLQKPFTSAGLAQKVRDLLDASTRQEEHP